MDRQPLYFTIFILTILIGSSFYLSWAVDRGMGSVTVEKLSIESAPGRIVELLVYAPRTGTHLEPMPVILTLHGLTGTKEGMYSFNVELARRNFTVVSIDLPGHGDSTQEFNITDFQQMAQDAYAAVRHIQTTYPNIDNESYGVLSHSLGLRVAIELIDFPVEPMAYVAVGDVGKLGQDDFIDFPENILFAVGSFDEIVTKQDALQAIRTATGNASATDGVTYGSLDNQTAFRLAFGPSNHVFEVVDHRLVTEAVSWLVQGVQGEDQLIHTRDPTNHVYFNKNIATILGSFFLLISVIPVMWLVYIILPERLKPNRIPIETQTQSVRRAFEVSSVLGAAVVGLFVAMLLIGQLFEDVGMSVLRMMSSTGYAIFLVLTPVVVTVLMIFLVGHGEMIKALKAAGVMRPTKRSHVLDLLKCLIVAGVGIVWFLFWLALANSFGAMQPGILLVLVRWPTNIRLVYTVILTVLAIPFFLVESAWIRGIILGNREWLGKLSRSRKILFAVISKFVMAALLTVIVILGTTSVGVSSGGIVLIGVLWVRVLLIQLLAAVMTTWESLEFENTLATTIMSSFILALVVVTTLPLT